MTNALILRPARAVFAWLLGRQPSTRPRAALAWFTAVVACALAVEVGLLAAALTAAWWLVAGLAALLWHAGPPPLVAVAVLAGARRALRGAAPAGPHFDAAPAAAIRSSSGDTDPADHLDGAAPAPNTGSSDTRRHQPDQPADGQTADGQTTPDSDADPLGDHSVSAVPDGDAQPDPKAEPGADPLAVDAAWLEAHWATEPHGAQPASRSTPVPS